MSSSRSMGTDPLLTAWVRFLPRYEVPELNVMSPGIVMSIPPRMEGTPCWSKEQTSTISLEGEEEGSIGEGTGRHGGGPIGEYLALEAKLVLEKIVLDLAVLTCVAGGSIKSTGMRKRGGGERGQSE